MLMSSTEVILGLTAFSEVFSIPPSASKIAAGAPM